MMHTPSIWRDFDRSFPPMSSWRPLLQQFDDMFNDMLNFNQLPARDGKEISLTPACDIDETNDKYILSFDMPGVPKENLNIEVRNNTLFVSGERHSERNEENKQFSRNERRYGKFVRSISLPENIKSDDVEAHYEDGVLAIVIPKGSEQWTRKIEVSQGKPGFIRSLLGRKNSDEQPSSLKQGGEETTRH